MFRALCRTLSKVLARWGTPLATPLQTLEDALEAEVQRCLQDADSILTLAVRTDAARDVVLAVRARYGAAGVAIFPSTEPIVTLAPQQALLCTWTTMSQYEAYLLQGVTNNFASWLNGVAEEEALQQVLLPTREGELAYVPLTYDKATMKQAVLTAYVLRYLTECYHTRHPYLTGTTLPPPPES